MVKLVFYLLYCCAAIKSCGLSGILFKAMDQIEKFVKDSGLTISAYNVRFYDSNGTDEILDNILCGKKRANTGLFSLFEAQMQLLPRTGDYTCRTAICSRAALPAPQRWKLSRLRM